MSWTTYRKRPDAYLDEAFDTAKRIAVSEYLMDQLGVGRRLGPAVHVGIVVLTSNGRGLDASLPGR